MTDHIIYAAEGMPRAFTVIGYALNCNSKYRSLNRGKDHAYWYRLGAKLGDYMGAYNLAQCYESGDGVARNMRAAVFWWRKAAACGYPKALTCLADAYYNGTGVRKNLRRALDLYLQSSQSGDKVARAVLRKL